MGTRELLILILGLAVIAVILRGLYVAIQARRKQIRLAIDKNIPHDIDLEELELSELPSGGARVVKRSLARVNRQNSMQNELDLGGETDADESVPILLDTVEIRQDRGTRDAPAQAEAVRRREDESVAVDHPEVEADELPLEEPAEARLAAEFTGAEQDEELPQPMASLSADDQNYDVEDDAADPYLDDEDGSEDMTLSYAGAEQYDDEPDADENREEAAGQQSISGEVFDELVDEERQEPGLDFDDDLEDEFGDFSLTAGERIGAPETEFAKGSQQTPFAGRSATEERQRKGSLFSRFGKKDNVDTAAEEYFDEAWDESDDPLFSSPSAKRGMTASDTGSNEAFRKDEASADVTTSRVPEDRSRSSRSVTIDEGIQPEPVESSAKAGVTDFNQARESRRPATSSSNGSAATNGGSRRDFEPSEVLVVNVMSREGETFSGPDLLQVLITAGLKHGDMNIFHKHLNNSADGPIVFSVANILNPGTFDLDDIEGFETRGVSLFLAMPAVISNREAFEDMLRIAQQIRAALDGELRDDRRSVMTQQTIEHYRQRIQDYELRKLKAAQAQS